MEPLKLSGLRLIEQHPHITTTIDISKLIIPTTIIITKEHKDKIKVSDIITRQLPQTHKVILAINHVQTTQLVRKH